MAAFEKITLEFVRPGPQHNQLLSPLTPYMALCGDGQPVTLHIRIEHHKLLNRLRRLRYVMKNGTVGGVAVPDPMREAEVLELGGEVASILSEIQVLNSEISRAQGRVSSSKSGEVDSLVHLQFVLSGSELSLIPFELAIAPQAFPGEGLEFCLQNDMPIVITPEIRQNRPVPIAWDRPIEPRILFISAEPSGMTVPKKAHVHALRQAMEPWIRWPRAKNNNTDRTQWVKERLRLLINPCINEIYDECATGQYTHIHILAHGASYEEAGEQRFGLALCQKHDKNQAEIISGKRLAKALQAEFADCPGRSQSLIVTLATCDSGNPGSLLIPGGSIAYDLHAEGIPWVFASQFPLTKRGSVKMTETLYPQLLRGVDPRQVLYEVRRQLFMTSKRDHDWASMIAFVSMPANTSMFENQVVNFFERQMRRAIEVSFDRADNSKDDGTDTMKTALDNVKKLLKSWECRLPTGQSMDDRSRRAECFGLHGSAYKRIALLLSTSKTDNKKPAGKAFINSHAYYKKAMNEMVVVDNTKYYWTATQYLCLAAVIKPTKPDQETYRFVRKLIKEDLDKLGREDQAWAHGTMAELELLSLFHEQSKDDVKLKTVKEEVLRHCSKVVDLKGAESFHAMSTARQFQRYIDHWLNDESDWKKVAQAAVDELTPKTDVSNEEFPPY